MAGTIGQQLRSAREERGVSLQDVENTIHIRVRYLEALENDDFSSMPSKAQARGFLRLYADFLKIPAFAPAEIEPPAAPASEDSATHPASAPAINEPAGEIGASIPAADESDEVSPAARKKTRKRAAETQAAAAESNPSDKAGPATPELAYLPIYREIGNQLRKRRETLSLSLDDISLHTRIKRENLEIIEAGNLDELPSPVQARGTISNYAEFLNLDSDALLTRFADALQLKRLELLPPQVKVEKAGEGAAEQITLLQKISRFPPIRQVSHLLTPDLLIGGSLALLLVILVVWGAVQVIKPASPESMATAPSISDVLLTTPTMIPGLSSSESLGANTAIPNASEEPESPAATPVAVTVEGTQTYNQGSQPIQVYVIANQRAFLKVLEDGSVKFNERVVPGNAYQFSGYNRVELTTGNGAALQVIYNETNLGILGDTGSVIRLVFTREGFATATPAQPATATSTRQPTLTLQPSVTPTVTPYVP